MRSVAQTALKQRVRRLLEGPWTEAPTVCDVLANLPEAGPSDVHLGDVLDVLELLVFEGELRAFRPITPNGPREPLRFTGARA